MHFSRLLRDLETASKDFTYFGVHFHEKLRNSRIPMDFTKFHKNHMISHFRVKSVLRPPGLGAPIPWIRISAPRQGSGCGGRQSEWVRLRRAWGARGRPRSPVAAVGSPTSAMTFSLFFTGPVPESSGGRVRFPPFTPINQCS